jgi:hypothetical protein
MNLPTSSLNFSGLINQLVNVINAIIPVLGSIALLIFFYGLVKYVYGSSDSHSHNDGKELIIWGLVAIFVLFSVWGIINVFKSALFG